MTENTVEYEPIGVIRTPFDSPEGMPIQPGGAEDAVGTVSVADSYEPALRDLSGFSHCLLVYHFHRSEEPESLQVEPFLDDTERGLFATRAPRRPNPIGLSVVEIESVSGTEVTVNGIDVVDGTPLLDIKPYVPAFDRPAHVESGWIAESDSRVDETRADDRFL